MAVAGAGNTPQARLIATGTVAAQAQRTGASRAIPTATPAPRATSTGRRSGTTAAASARSARGTSDRAKSGQSVGSAPIRRTARPVPSDVAAGDDHERRAGRHRTREQARPRCRRRAFDGDPELVGEDRLGRVEVVLADRDASRRRGRPAARPRPGSRPGWRSRRRRSPRTRCRSARPARKLMAIAAAASAWIPRTRQPGSSDRSHEPTPLISAPLPTGTDTIAGAGRSPAATASVTSSASVAAPVAIRGSAPSTSSSTGWSVA